MITNLSIVVFPFDLALIKEGESWLDEEERLRLNRMTDETIRNRFVGCRSILRQQLAKAMNCRESQLKFTYGPSGKPMIAGSPKSFNITHSGDYGIIAVSDAPAIGVDVERVQPKRNLAGIGKYVFHPDELAALDKATEAQKLQLFYDVWVRKEAVTKLLGDSIFQVRDISVIDSIKSPASLWIRKRGTAWVLPVTVSSRYAAAVAIATAPDAGCPLINQTVWQ